MNFKSICLALACAATTLPAHAANIFSTKYDSYISLSSGRSNSPGTCTYILVNGASCSEKDTVYRVAYGHQFTSNWGIEVGYGDFGRASEKGTLPATPSGVPGSGPIPYTWEWSAIGWEVAGTGTLHLGDSLSITGKLGVLSADIGSEVVVTTSTNEIWHSVARDTSTNISRGLGIRYDFNKDFALRLQHESFGELGKNSKIKTTTTYLGFLLKF
jgi:OOP family OmpA-OmpF porin